jgi:hypothetical protein
MAGSNEHFYGIKTGFDRLCSLYFLDENRAVTDNIHG